MADTPYTYVVTGAARYPGATRDEQYGVTTYPTKTGALPKGLEGRTPLPYTWERYIQALLNNEPLTPNDGTPVDMTTRPHQAAVVDQITAAYNAHLAGFVLAYPTGSGKTYMALEAINRVAPERVLVIAPLSSLTDWRAALKRYATGPTEWVVTNPDQLVHLFTTEDSDAPPLHAVPADDRVNLALTHGTPLADFDVVITDEAQILAHATTDRAQLWQRLIGWSDTGANPRSFTIHLSATAWSNPQETTSVAHILAGALGVSVPSSEQIIYDYSGWLRAEAGMSLTADESGRWRWDANPRDVDRLTRLLYRSGMGASASREELGLLNQTRSLHFVTFSPAEHAAYEQAWEEFSAQHDILSGLTSADAAPAHYIRAIQKAAVIKAPHIAQLVVDYLANGYQVVVPAWLSSTVRTLQDEINRAAEARLPTTPPLGYWAGSLTGATPADHRAHKIKFFQGGYLPVIVTSVVEGINLHAGQTQGTFATEANPEATATSAPRVTVFGDVIHGGKRAFQAEGRASRETTVAEAVYCCAIGTREAEAWAGVFHSLADTRALGTYGDRVLTDSDIRSFADMREQILDTMESPR